MPKLRQTSGTAEEFTHTDLVCARRAERASNGNKFERVTIPNFQAERR
ncbi:hypothetical protein M1N05_01610 [Dehalococcoidales bacterium]|nr:hypothetical protein [Dehalococcoidales bacterium]